MALDDMLIFTKVVEAKSFTEAARHLDMPKQTVSRRIVELEGRLGVQLLYRTTRRVEVTEIGAAYYERCAQIVAEASEAERAISEMQAAPRGTLRITAPFPFAEMLLTPVITAYLKRYPEVQIDVQLSQERLDLLSEGIDLAIRIGTPEDSSLIARKLGPAATAYCASPEYVAARGKPETPRELRNHDCIVLASGEGSVPWKFAGTKGEFAVSIAGRVRCNSFEMTYQAALAGLGVARLPAFACAQDLHEGRLVALLEPWVSTRGAVYVVCPGSRRLSPKVRSFMDLLVAEFARDKPWGPPARVTQPR